ncbi:plant UBX domain-containing protein 4-like [Carya illinoinensis]|uniref:plant UBX domain-containing protein 4-like n=1 Tax=Carya illinoinensis TaxID=32201 RepID=UPI001C721D78|nr:plant UBX domain-containing protein 4-like [Carya illinoinensis]
MQTIRKSECPRELEPADRRSSVHVNLIRSVNLIRRNDNCPEPERHHVPGSWNFVINSVSSGTNDQMDMEDSMVEDTVQASTPIAPIFGQPPVLPPQSGSVFGSANSTSSKSLPICPTEFGHPTEPVSISGYEQFRRELFSG